MSASGSLTATLREAQVAFASHVEALRPDLHRYCARMTGSVLDGEDLVQETFAQACYGLSLLRQEVPLRPWLFQIAHHKCVDFLRSRALWSTTDLDEGSEPTMEIAGEIEDHDAASRAFTALVLLLPPRERASVLLKDVLGYSLPEIAGILQTSVGAVKAAVHRGRQKLAELQGAPLPERATLRPEVQRYIDSFNRRDWAGLSLLLEEDVRCEVVGHAHLAGQAALQSNYLVNYANLPFLWRLVTGTVDGEPAVICLREDEGRWTPHHALRLEWRDGRITRIRDYVDVPELFRDARVVASP